MARNKHSTTSLYCSIFCRVCGKLKHIYARVHTQKHGTSTWVESKIKVSFGNVQHFIATELEWKIKHFYLYWIFFWKIAYKLRQAEIFLGMGMCKCDDNCMKKLRLKCYFFTVQDPDFIFFNCYFQTVHFLAFFDTYHVFKLDAVFSAAIYLQAGGSISYIHSKKVSNYRYLVCLK